jgi:4-hydroxy-3-polyprenylbenzoate decarboxylase
MKIVCRVSDFVFLGNMIDTFHSLREFLEFCSRHDQLRVIDRPVDRNLEICEISDREMKRPGGGKALLFTNVIGSRFPVAVNVMGSSDRVAWALGSHSLAQVEARIRGLTDIEPPRNLREAGELLFKALDLRHAPIRKVRKAAVHEVLQDQVDLSQLPVLTTWPEDGGPFLTYPMVFSQGRDGRSNCGMYRMQVLDQNTTGMHWQRHKDGRSQSQDFGRPMPVAVALGGPPILTYSATAPLPPGIFEMLLAGFLGRRRVPMVKCRTSDLMVPAEADFVLEGEVDASDLRWEGPFGDHTGFYSQADWYPAFKVKAVSHRRDAIYPATIVGLPPVEDAYLGEATERIFLPLLQRVHGEIGDMRLPIEGAFHNLVLLSVKKRFPGHARKTFAAVWGTGQMMFTKYAAAFRPDMDLKDTQGLLEEIGAHWDCARDTARYEGPTDTLDHAPNARNLGSKLGIDATPKLPEEHRPWPDAPESARQSAADWSLNSDRFPEVRDARLVGDTRVLLLSMEKRHARHGREVLERLEATDIPAHTLFVVASDDPGFLNDLPTAMLVGFGNTDPGRDVLVLKSRRPGGALGFDATRKLPEEGYAQGPWPALISQDPAVVAKVDGYAKEIWHE